MDAEKQFEHGLLTVGAVGKIAADSARNAEGIAELREAIANLHIQLTAALLRIDELEETIDDIDDEVFGAEVEDKQAA